MSRKHTVLAVSLFGAACLALGTLWTLWVDEPLRIVAKTPSDARLRVEVWEDGHDMATVSMSVPKRPLDAMFAFGFDPKVHVACHGETMDLRELVRAAQLLPPGKRLTYRDREGTMYVWIERGSRAANGAGPSGPATSRAGV